MCGLVLSLSNCDRLIDISTSPGVVLFV